MNENQQILNETEDDLVRNQSNAIDFSTEQSDDYVESGKTSNELSKVFLGGLIGATLGAVAGALLIKGTAQKINKTVKNVGDTVKNASGKLNQTVKDIADAVQTVAGGVNDTVKDVGETVTYTATDINETVTNTVDAVKGSASGMKETVTTTVDAVKEAASGVSESVKGNANIETEDVTQSNGQIVNLPNNQMAYMLVPVDHQKK